MVHCRCPETLRKVVSMMKIKDCVSHRNRSEHTIPGVGNTFLQRGWAGPEVWISPKIQNIVDLGVDLHHVQLLGEGEVRTT
jgi:hypothetical protein